MIKKLKKKYIIVTMLVLFSVFFIVVATINTVNYINVNKKANNIIDIIEKNNGQIPGFIKPGVPKDKFDDMHGEIPFSTRYFTVTFENKEIVSINLDKIATIDSIEATQASERLYSKNKKSGFYNNFKYRLVKTDTGEMYIFLDCTMELENFQEFLIASIWTSVGGLLVIFILVFIASSIATKPIAESYSKQKEFITNINHEIKTPLSIIKAANEVIELENGTNEWTEIIDSQINKLTDLTESLVYLSRMDEENNKLSKIEFNLTQIAYEVSEPFVMLAKSKNKELNIAIEENMTYYGEVSLIGQLISILLDNAIKYSNANSTINLKVYTHSKYKKIVVSNETSNIEVGKMDYLFERFYRAKNETKGHGIGLSIAKAIVSSHKGKIQAYSEDGHIITFVATI